jgi:hypothetical protein
MKYYLFIAIAFIAVCCNEEKTNVASENPIAQGQMPNIASDRSGHIQLVYGRGDSIMYCSSSDQGKTFSDPVLAATLPDLAASHTRGPQLAVTSRGLVMTACTGSGNIFSFVKDDSGKWQQGQRVNDVDTVAKENLMALSADGPNAFAVWLDLRDRHNKIVGAKSTDGGKTWNRNILIYSSPDSSVCECCKPSVVVRGNNVYVMFRNWLNGNRDLYLTASSDGGTSFRQVQKLGKGSWALKGCPMDGGAITVNKNGEVQTVWNRKGIIYSSEPDKEEEEIGVGRSCTIETVNGKNVYGWVENGEVVLLESRGVKKMLGRGQLPVIKAIDSEHIICVWENDKQIHKAIVKL